MKNDNHNYENRVNDILSMSKELKENISKKDYSKEKIIDIWIKLLDEN